MAERKTISAREVIADIRVGMTDDQLMRKHSLSAKGLQSLTRKLIEAGLISRAELDRRTTEFEETIDLDTDAVTLEKTVGPSHAEGTASQESAGDILSEFAARFRISKEDIERLKSASVKDLKAILEKYDIPQEEVAKLLKAYSGQAGAVASEAKHQLLGSLRELVSAAQSEGDEEDKMAGLKKVPLKPLMMAAAALMFGWFWADVFTRGWLIFFLLFIIFTAAAFIGSFFLAEKSKFQTRLSAKHFGIIAAVFLVLNIVTIGGDGGSTGGSGTYVSGSTSSSNGSGPATVEGKIVSGDREKVKATLSGLNARYGAQDDFWVSFVDKVPLSPPSSPTYVQLYPSTIKKQLSDDAFLMDTGDGLWVLRLTNKLKYSPRLEDMLGGIGLVVGPTKLTTVFGGTQNVTLVEAVAVKVEPAGPLYY